MNNLSALNDSCIKPLLLNLNSSCPTTTWTSTSIQLVSEDKILVTNGQHTKLKSDCSPHQKTITGNALITMNNCEVIIADTTYTSKTISNKTDIHGLFYDNIIELQDTKIFNIEEIDKATINNTLLLKHIKLKQFDQNKWINVLLSGLAIIIAIGVSLTLTICIYLMRPKKPIPPPVRLIPLTAVDVRLPHPPEES